METKLKLFDDNDVLKNMAYLYIKSIIITPKPKP